MHVRHATGERFGRPHGLESGYRDGCAGDHCQGRPRSPAPTISYCLSAPHTNPDAPTMLDRILRLLASYSILTCSPSNDKDGHVERLYGLAPVCKFLVKNQDNVSIAPLVLLNQDKVLMESWYLSIYLNLSSFLFLYETINSEMLNLNTINVVVRTIMSSLNSSPIQIGRVNRNLDLLG